MTVAQAGLVAAVCTLIALAAVAGAVAIARDWTPRRRAGRRAGWGPRMMRQLPPAWRGRYRTVVGVAVAVGLVVWIITGWPIQGLIAAAVVLGVPFVLQPGGPARERIDRLEALAEWLTQLAGVHVAGLSLEQTIRAGAKNAPATVRPYIHRLTVRLQRGWPAEEAYRALADEMEDGAVDHAVLLLQTHARDRGPGLSRAVEALAESLRSQAADARATEAERNKARTSARWISLLSVGAVVGLLLFNQTYTAPYQTPMGQVLLVLLGGAFAGLLFQMHRLGRPETDGRLLAPRPGTSAAALTESDGEEAEVQRS